MYQPTFASVEFEQKKRKTRREVFLERLDALVPWEALETRIEPHYPKPGRGRQPYPLAVMLRIHVVQLSYTLSDPAMEDLLYEAESARRFCGLTLREPIPDKSTILHFRHLLERHALGTPAQGHDRGRHDHRGAVVDEEPPARARPGDAPDEEGEYVALWDEAAHRRRYRDEAGAQPAHHGGERGRRDGGAPVAARRRAGGVRGLPGLEKRPEQSGEAVAWRVAMRPGLRRRLAPGSAEALEQRRLAWLRAKVEHPFLAVKRRFGYATARDRGLAKNRERLTLLLGLTNLLAAEPQLA